MSQENVELVRRGFEAWEVGDLSGLLALLDDDLVTRRLAPMPDPGTWHGPEGLLEVAAEWMEAFDEFTMKAEEFIDARDVVVVRVAQGGRGGGSGARVTGTFWFVYGMRDGKVVALDMYATRGQALEAAGLSE
jgi:ketosteroid isomerase-like protein